MRIDSLHCDYMVNPIGFDLDQPLLSWTVRADGHNHVQSAYQLQVTDGDDFDALLLDTGKQPGDISNGYALDLPLSPRTRYTWRVRIWDESDTPTPFSTPATFETGRYDEPWAADWIGGTQAFPQLRRMFCARDGLRRARLYASGVGLYRAFLNGQPVSDEVLAPGITAYDRWIQYQTYDVTGLVQSGDNALGAWLGNGYYKGRIGWPGIEQRHNVYGDQLAFIAELVLEYDDGSEERVLTDPSWRTADSPFLRAEIYDGEVYDARLEVQGWSAPRLDDTAWAHAIPISIDKGLLAARLSPPVRVTERIAPVAMLHTPAGETVVDFGQNFAGWVHIDTDAPAGTEILLQFGEALDADGNFYRENMRTALAEYRYIADGTRRSYAPHFTFFGFRYARITGWPGTPALSSFIGEVVHSDLACTGTFSCSDARVNRLFENTVWGQRSNFVDNPTDCPQRDERLGWTGDAQVFCATACMNMQSDAFFRKYLRDLAYEQAKMGFVPVVIPFILEKSGVWQEPTTGWGDAATIIPWMLYLYYGDTAILDRQYDSMKAWVDYMHAQDTLGVDRYYGNHLGDWLAQDTKDANNVNGLTPTDLIATAYYAYSADIVAKTAVLLGKEADAATYAALAERIRIAFRKEYVSPNGRIVSETQTAQLVALQTDMVLPEQRPVVSAHLAERLRIDRLHLTTGFIGTPYLCPVLSENGLNEYAYALLLSTGMPSWLHAVNMGATTMWERWNSVREDGSFGPADMNSLNHYAFGSIAEWMYRYVAGISPMESAPGYKRVHLAPMPNDLLTHAQAAIETPYGPVRSAWTLLEDGTIELEFEIPFNTTAEIHLPDAQGATILENGEIATCEPEFSRGSGIWRYAYRPTGETIHKHVTA